MYKWMTIIFSMAIAVATSACGPKSMVVLAPDPDGSVGRITVTNEAGSIQMDQAHQHTMISSNKKSPSEPTPVDPSKVQDLFGEALAAQPPEPEHFLFYFQSDSIELLEASRQKLSDIVAVIDQRMPTTISVVGHSDTQGDSQYNLALSLRRANAVKHLLTNMGVPEDAIIVSSHGEENPLVKTADNVSNVKNRRVEVIVR
jgi:outer membrane protein OmpA-like peptidoglycan-associated protein